MKRDDASKERKSLQRYKRAWAIESVLWLFNAVPIYFVVGASATVFSLIAAALCWIPWWFLEIWNEVDESLGYSKRGNDLLVRTTYSDYWSLFISYGLVVLLLICEFILLT